MQTAVRHISAEHHSGAGLEPRYALDGQRVSKSAYDYAMIRARMGGRMSCLITTSRRAKTGRSRWTHHALLSY